MRELHDELHHANRRSDRPPRRFQESCDDDRACLHVFPVGRRNTSVGEVNRILSEEAATQRYAGVLGVSRDPLVSSDIIGDPRASVVDLDLTKVIDGDLVKIMSWYDNEWGYANQMVREAVALTNGR